MHRTTQPMTSADRNALTRRLADGTGPSALRLLMWPTLAVFSIILIVVSFRIVKDPNAGPLVFVAMLMLILGAVVFIVALFKSTSDIAQARETLATRKELEIALAAPHVEVITLKVTAAWFVPWSDDDVEPPVLLCDEAGEFLVLCDASDIIDTEEEQDEEFISRIPAQITLRITQSPCPLVLHAAATGNDIIVLHTKAKWPDDYKAYQLPIDTEEITILTLADLTPSWRTVLNK